MPKDKKYHRKWVYSCKYKYGRSYEYKVRFVAKAYLHIYGKDYNETFPLMTNMASIKLLLQLAVQYDLLIHHMDVKSVFNAPLDYEIYVDLPEGFEGKNRDCLETFLKNPHMG